jgi:alcohol dehydrogenase (cytochrome c)
MRYNLRGGRYRNSHTRTTMTLRNLLLMVLLVGVAPHATAQTLFSGGSPVRGDATAGQATYSQSCMACHGARLEGSPFAPTLVGKTFQDHWRGKPAAELLAQMRKTMPPKGTGTVKPAAFPDLVAFVLQANEGGPEFLAKLPGPTAATSATAISSTRIAPLPPAVARRLAGLSAVTDALLAAPPDGDWLAWRRTLDSAGFSPLKLIDRRTVRRLQKAWSLPLDPSTNEIAPLVHEGVLFVHSGVVLIAVDAATGMPLWKYQREIARPAAARRFDPARQARVKSIALYGHSLLMPTPDGHVVALDARSGKLLWDRAINSGAASSGLQVSSGPLVARGVVMIGVSLGLTNKGGCFIVGLDAATGAERWRFQTVARPGTPGADTWNGAPAEERFGAGVWTTGSYDPQLNLAYFGVGNTYTTATLLQPRPGASGVSNNDGLYTDATIALRPETGELVWHHQHHRRDVWDQDWAFEQTLVTLGSGATARRVVLTSGKTAVFEAVDAATGKFLFAHDTGMTNLFAAIDPATGEKRTNPALEPAPGKPLLLCPGNLGARNWPATSFDPGTGMLFVPMLESCAEFTWEPRGAKETANGGSDIRFSPKMRPGSDGKLGRMIAIDLNARRIAWTHRQRMPLASSLLATAGGVVFMGDVDRNFGAYDQTDGALLWKTRLPASAESTPISFMVGKQQYVAVVSGEGSHLGQYNRGLVPELGEPVTEISLVVFALR